MVKIMENPIKMDDLGGFPPFSGNTDIQPVLFLFLFLSLAQDVPVHAHVPGTAFRNSSRTHPKIPRSFPR